MKKFLFKISIFLTLFVSAQASSPTKEIWLKEILPDTHLPDTGEFVFIDSQGGVIDRAWGLVPSVQNKTCIVKRAGSAALMIVLPACKERYYLPEARLEFHNAVIMIPPLMLQGVVISQWDAEMLAKSLKDDNDRMLAWMLDQGVPFSEAFLRIHMALSTVVAKKALGYWEPWLKPIAHCHHCPAWTKMIEPVTDTP